MHLFKILFITGFFIFSTPLLGEAANGHVFQPSQPSHEVLAPTHEILAPTDVPPNEPESFYILSSTSNFLTLTWEDRIGQDYQVFRKTVNSDWIMIAEMETTSNIRCNMQRDRRFFSPKKFCYEDLGLVPDTRYLYKVRKVNQFGTGPYSFERNSFTKGDPQAGNHGEAVWRVQLEILVANINDAGTDNSLKVFTTKAMFGDSRPIPNPTWLNYSIDDFERGSTFTYNLEYDGISQLQDLHGVVIRKEGTDGIAIRALRLIVNEIEVYEVEYSGSPVWIDNNDGHPKYLAITHEDMRAHPKWQSYNHQNAQFISFAFPGIEKNDVVKQIEGQIGDAIHSNALYWGKIDGDAVEVTNPLSSSSCNGLENQNSCFKQDVDIDLAVEINNWRNPAVDVDFSIFYSCSINGFVTSVTRPRVHSSQSGVISWIFDKLTLTLLNNYIEDEVTGQVTRRWPSTNASSSTIACMVSTDSQGSILLREL